MKYFGTDGIRGKANSIWFDKIIVKVAKALVQYYNKNKLKKQILIGNDSRISCDYILAKLSTILLKNNIEIHNLNLCSSPCLAYTTKQFNYPLGIMISASHNPYEFNGIKFFTPDGKKVDEKFEIEFEKLMDKKIKLKNNEFKKLKNVEYLQENYINMLKKLKKIDFLCIFDCSNGGISEICKKIFYKHEIIYANPNGKNINDNCGSTHIEMLKFLCVKNKKIGFAFDGDGDRICVIDSNGTIISGDEILFILSKFYLKNSSNFIGTIYTNQALENELKKRDIKTIRSDVGEKFIYDNLNTHFSSLGGEDSGHIIVRDFTQTSDGILTAILIGNIIESTHSTCSELIKNYHGFFQKRKDIILPDNPLICEEIKQIISFINLSIQTSIYDHQTQFGNIQKPKCELFYKNEKLITNLIEFVLKEKLVKIILRMSGTEPVIRLFVESENEKRAIYFLNKLNSVLNILIS